MSVVGVIVLNLTFAQLATSKPTEQGLSRARQLEDLAIGGRN